MNCLCLVESDQKILMIWDCFGDICGSAGSWFLYLHTRVTPSFCPHYNWAAIINLDLVSDGGVWKQQNFQGYHYRRVSHIPSWSFCFVPLAAGNIYTQLCHRMMIPAWSQMLCKYSLPEPCRTFPGSKYVVVLGRAGKGEWEGKNSSPSFLPLKKNRSSFPSSHRFVWSVSLYSRTVEQGLLFLFLSTWAWFCPCFIGKITEGIAQKMCSNSGMD